MPDYLVAHLWEDRTAYNAGHYLMVPMHAAFALNEKAWQRAFADHFQRFMRAELGTPAKTERLARLQYLYAASWFIVLARESSDDALVPQGLAERLFETFRTLWLTEPAWQWDREPFHGSRDRVLWKLQTLDVAKSYYRGIHDEELLLMAIAANLLRIHRDSDKAIDRTLLEDARDIAERVFRQETTMGSDGGWLFQPGVWADHSEYLYAGCPAKKVGLTPVKVKDVAADSSHSHRMPLYLRSFGAAFPAHSSGQEYFKFLLAGLDRQLFDHVLRLPNKEFPACRTTNYMDGSNGVYRWQYSSLGGGGYGPYELSGTLTLGWWTFLGSSRIRRVYQDLADLYPLPEAVVVLYGGPDDGDHEMRARTFAFRELHVRLAAKLP